jgi:hypothetical protein
MACVFNAEFSTLLEDKSKASYSVVFEKVFTGFTWEDHSVYISLTLSTNLSHSRHRPVFPRNVVLRVVGIVAEYLGGQPINVCYKSM